MQVAGGSKPKTRKNRPLQPKPGGVETTVMQQTGSSAVGSRWPIIPKWEDRQVCLITCWTGKPVRAFLGIVFGVLATTVAFCGEPVLNPTNSLNFFVVSDEAIKDGRYVDTPEFPKLGYISKRPNLIVTGLQFVATNSHAFITTYQGKTTQSTETVVEITLRPSDAKIFAKLTADNALRRVLITLGERPLLAPMVMQPINTGRVAISAGTNADFPSVLRGLQRLAPDE